MRKNKGITLIALVITIIVLLILAGVALRMVAGNEGILTKAEKAVNETNIAGAKEQVELMIAELSADYYEKKFVDKTVSGSLVDYIKDKLSAAKPTSNGEFSVSIDGSGNVSVTDKGGNSVVSGSLDENGKIIWGESTGGNGGGSGEVTPEEIDAKYFTFEPNEDGTTATITGVKDEYAEKVEVKGITATLVIKDGENYIKDVVLPSKIKDEAGNEYTVTAIGEMAFCGDPTDSEMSQFTSFVIPDTVESIGRGAFGFCVSLNSINIPDSVTSIGETAFFGCTSLSTITVEEENTVYDSRDNSNAIIETATNTLVLGCKNTNIPDSVTSIGDGAFGGCTSLSSINIPESVTSIGGDAFDGCTSLSSINIPDSVTSIGEWAFYGCTNLSSINIPESVTSIGDCAFYGWTEEQTINCEILEANKPSGWDAKWDYYAGSTARKAKINWGVSM